MIKYRKCNVHISISMSKCQKLPMSNVKILKVIIKYLNFKMSSVKCQNLVYQSPMIKYMCCCAAKEQARLTTTKLFGHLLHELCIIWGSIRTISSQNIVVICLTILYSCHNRCGTQIFFKFMCVKLT